MRNRFIHIPAALPLFMALTILTPQVSHASQESPPQERDRDHLTLALVNLKSLYTDSADTAANAANLDANLKRHLAFIDLAANRGADFVGFPELSVNGYHFSRHMTWLRLEGPEVVRLAEKAVERRVYVAVGVAEQDAAGKRWNTHVVIGPDGKIVGAHHKIWLTKEEGFVERGTDHKVFDVQGMKVGIATCADGTDFKNLEALARNGARLIYAPHANTTGGTTAGWYKFRAAWAGPEGWIAKLKVYAALHNQAGLYGTDVASQPAGSDADTGWASGAWFIGPDGQTVGQMPVSTDRAGSKEFVLMCKVPLREAEARR